jgi:hypothetical protein
MLREVHEGNRSLPKFTRLQEHNNNAALHRDNEFLAILRKRDFEFIDV